MRMLRPSRAYERLAGTVRAQTRNYCAAIKLLQSTTADVRGVLTDDVMTFRNFTWALSVVMTRQNALPDPWGLSLVPLWDMCNHSDAGADTEVAVCEGALSIRCVARGHVAEGEAVGMRYGSRDNVELALFSGFVQSGNKADRVRVGLGGGEGGVWEVKKRVLKGFGVVVAEGGVVQVEFGWGEGVEVALAVARVVCMGKGELADVMRAGRLPDVGWEKEARRHVRMCVEARLEEYVTDRDAPKLVAELLEQETGILKEALGKLVYDE